MPPNNNNNNNRVVVSNISRGIWGLQGSLRPGYKNCFENIAPWSMWVDMVRMFYGHFLDGENISRIEWVF
jgi:hypothetical protein